MERTDLEKVSNNAAENWRQIVIISLATNEHDLRRVAASVCASFGSTTETMMAKMRSARHAIQAGQEFEEVVRQGQSITISRHARARAQVYGPQRVLSFRVSRDLADSIECEHPAPGAPEPVCTRLHRVCGITTADDLLDFFKSVVDLASDEELRHHAGLIDKMRKMRRV